MAPPAEVGIDPARLDDLFARAQREVSAGNIGSCQLAVARHGRLAAFRTFGEVTHEGRPAPATDDTLYVVFSCTKGIVSAAIWLLVQEGQLDPSERVADIVPEFGSNGKEVVTVEQVMTHTSGFPNAPYPAVEWADREKRLERFGRWRLEWEPGSRYVYHPTSGMWVMAEILERRTGTDYRTFVHERIAKPLGLPEMRLGLPRALHHRLADIEYRGQEPTADELVAAGWPAELPKTEVTEDLMIGFNRDFVREAGVPGGGAVMTAAELALFYQALLDDGRAPDGTSIWTPETLRWARRPRTGDLVDPMFQKPIHRAFGICIAGDEARAYRGFGGTNSPDAFGHGGAGGQIGWADPATGISFAFLTHGFDRNPVRLARRGLGLSSRAAACAAE
jgi:CubicO group peptidase (beta-lactamase class C family)